MHIDCPDFEWVGRDDQLNFLRNMIKRDIVHTCIHVFGGPATGKTEIVRQILEEKNLNYAYLPCKEVISARSAFEDILSQLGGHDPSGANQYSVYRKCERGMASFAMHFEETINGEDGPAKSKGTSVIVIDDLEDLPQNARNMLPGLMNLHTATNCPVILIFISHGWMGRRNINNLFGSSGFLHPVHFPNYRDSDIKEILCARIPDRCKIKGSHYETLMQYLVDRVSASTTNIRTYMRLKHAVDCASICEGLTFKKCKALIDRLANNVLKENLRDENRNYTDSIRYLSVLDLPWSIQQEYTLSCTAQYLAIAAYLCAYNSQKFDLRYFGIEKVRGKRKKRSDPRGKALKERLSQKLTGSQTFPLSRMLAVFHKIWDNTVGQNQSNILSGSVFGNTAENTKPDKNGKLLSQIATLISLGILAKISKDPIEDVKMKCMLTHAFAHSLAQEAGFPMEGYLQNDQPV